MVTEIPDVQTLMAGMTQSLKCHLENKAINGPLLVGIRTGGVWLAEHLQDVLGISEAIGEMDISFYRDDFSQNGLHPHVQPSLLPPSIEGRHIVLVDDVLMSGRTIRAAMNELFDYGRPASITLVVLIDIMQREIPIQPDVLGQRLELPKGKRIKLTGPTPLQLDMN